MKRFARQEDNILFAHNDAPRTHRRQTMNACAQAQLKFETIAACAPGGILLKTRKKGEDLPQARNWRSDKAQVHFGATSGRSNVTARVRSKPSSSLGPHSPRASIALPSRSEITVLPHPSCGRSTLLNCTNSSDFLKILCLPPKISLHFIANT